MQPRKFNARQRLALLWASGGKCSICGKSLSTDWQADHIKPWSKLGLTVTANGQAVHKRCNCKKGAK
jgi:hypothetical protein